MKIEHEVMEVRFSADTNKFHLSNRKTGTITLTFQQVADLVEGLGLSKPQDLVGMTLMWDGEHLTPKDNVPLSKEEIRWLLDHLVSRPGGFFAVEKLKSLLLEMLDE